MSRCMVRLSKPVTTPDGPGVVVDNNALTETATVRVELSDGSYDMRSYHYSAVTPRNRHGDGAPQKTRTGKDVTGKEEAAAGLEDDET